MRGLRFVTSTLGAVALLLAPGAARAGTIEVTTTADQFGTRPSKCSLREAIRAASDDANFGGCDDRRGPDAIRLRARDYVLSRPGQLEEAGATGDLDVTGVLRIRGEGARRTTIDGGGIDRVLHLLPSARLTLVRLGVEGGDAPFGAGGIQTDQARLVLRSVRVARNVTRGTGGGLGGFESAMVLKRTTLVANEATSSGKDPETGGGIDLTGGSLRIKDSAVRNNMAGNAAGGIFLVAVSAVVRDSVIAGNESSLSGGVSVGEFDGVGTMRMIDTVVRGNESAGMAGGATVFNEAVLSLVRSRVASNRAAGAGGGVVLSSGRLESDRSTFVGNRAGTDGGAIFAERANFVGAVAPALDLQASTLSGSVAGEDGGAIFASDARSFLTNVTVSGNRAENDGGGLHGVDPDAADALMVIYNSTVTRNVAVSSGGGIDRGGGVGGPVILDHTIVARNTATTGPDCSGGPESQGRTLVGNATGCGLTAVAGEDQVGSAANPIHPRLGPLKDNGGPTRTHALRKSSPARNAGDARAGKGGCFFTDQRGVPRPVGRCDIGAYERVTCFRRAVDVVGTPGRDRLVGSRTADVFLALGGRDLILGRGGADRACGDRGADTVRGGPGNDRLSGGPGDDRLFGDAGEDRCRGGPGRDVLDSC